MHSLPFAVSATFGLHMSKPGKTDAGSVELLTAAFGVVVPIVVVVVLAPKIGVSALALAKLKPIEVVDGTAVCVVIDDETCATDVIDVTGELGFAAGVDEADKNEKLPTELVFVIGTEAAIGVFSLSFFGLSVAIGVVFAENALPRSNLNDDDVDDALTVAALDGTICCG